MASGDDLLRWHRLAVGLYDRSDDAGTLTRTDRFELDVAGPVTQLPQLVGPIHPALVPSTTSTSPMPRSAFDPARSRRRWHTCAGLDDSLAHARRRLVRLGI